VKENPVSNVADGNTKFVQLAAAISALGGLLFGYDTGVISSAILFIKQDFLLSTIAEEFLVSAVLFGAILGAIFGGTWSDRFGRRRIIILAALIFTFGGIGTAFANTVAWLLLGRVIVGIAIGVASFAAPLYISEVSPANVRGKLVSLNQLAITVGIVVSYLVGYALSGTRGWRWMFALAAIPSIALAVGMLIVPESPRWLVGRDLMEKAASALKRIRGTEKVSDELAEIRKSLARQSGNWLELFGPLVKPALFIGVGLAVFQQVTGINTVIYYAPTIFQFAGFQSASVAILATVGVGFINVLMTIVAMHLLDRVGRRPLLMTGLIGMILSLIVLGFAFALPDLLRTHGWIAVGSLMLYVAAFAIGLGPVFWLLISEIYPLKIRGLAMSIASVANWGANLVVALTFLTLTQAIGKNGTFWLYGFVSIGAVFFVHFLVPETKGRTLEEIESHWRSGKHPRLLGKRSEK
jgi:SP family galactose:H+ symporter-like MFS transporter